MRPDRARACHQIRIAMHAVRVRHRGAAPSPAVNVVALPSLPTNHKTRPVMCLESGAVHPSLSSAAGACGSSRQNLWQAIRRGRPLKGMRYAYLDDPRCAGLVLRNEVTQ